MGGAGLSSGLCVSHKERAFIPVRDTRWGDVHQQEEQISDALDGTVGVPPGYGDSEDGRLCQRAEEAGHVWGQLSVRDIFVAGNMYIAAEGAKQEAKMKDKKTIWAWLPVGVMLTVIFSLTLQSPEGTSHLSKWVQEFLLNLFDKGAAPAWLYDMHWVRSYAHIPLYFALSLTVYLALRASFAEEKPDFKGTMFLALLAAAVSSLVGLLDEFIKMFLPMREFDIVDLGIDVLASIVGAGVGAAVNYAFRR